MTPAAALKFVRTHGIILMSAKGSLPNLVDAIAGERISGSWWGHPKGKEIFRVASATGDSPDILCCRLVDSKITLVHRRLWPALVRLAPVLGASRLDQVGSEHTPSGAHRQSIVRFPRWVPTDVATEATALSEQEARQMLVEWPQLGLPDPPRPKRATAKARNTPARPPTRRGKQP